TMCHVNLNPVCAVIQLLASCFARFHWSIRNLCTLWHLQLRGVAFQVVSAGARDRARSCKEPRPRNRSFLDRLSDLYVTVACAFGLQVAQSCKTLLQRSAASKRRTRRTQSDARFQNVGVVTSLCWVLAPQENVSMRVNQARQHRRA